MDSYWVALFLLIIAALQSHISITEASTDIGVNYGLNGNNLPSPPDVINLVKKYGIGKVRLFDPNPSVLNALRGSQIEVSLGILNADLQNLASSPEAANSWFTTNVAPYLNDIVFSYITAGNEVLPGELGQYVAPAMRNIQNVLDSQKLAGIKVSTVVPTSVLGSSYPPSSGAFSDEVSASMKDVLSFLSAQGSPLLINVYPYFAYASDPVNIRLDYAQFTAPGPVVQDGSLSYQNMFDAIVDAFFWAMEKQGVSDVDVVVSESGWPSAGNGNLTTPQLAATYNKNFMQHVTRTTGTTGTPKRPQTHLEGFIFAMFNENLKPAGVEQNFGLFQPNEVPVYNIFN